MEPENKSLEKKGVHLETMIIFSFHVQISGGVPSLSAKELCFYKLIDGREQQVDKFNPSSAISKDMIAIEPPNTIKRRVPIPRILSGICHLYLHIFDNSA